MSVFSLFFFNVFTCSFRLKYSFFFLITSLSLSFEYNLMTVKSLCLGHRYRLYTMVVIHPLGSGTDAILPRCRVVGCGIKVVGL